MFSPTLPGTSQGRSPATIFSGRCNWPQLDHVFQRPMTFSPSLLQRPFHYVKLRRQNLGSNSKELRMQAEMFSSTSTFLADCSAVHSIESVAPFGAVSKLDLLPARPNEWVWRCVHRLICPILAPLRSFTSWGVTLVWVHGSVNFTLTYINKWTIRHLYL